MSTGPMSITVRFSRLLIAMPEGQSPGTEHVPDEFVKHSLLVGTETECVERLRDIIALEPDEVTFSISYAQVSDVEKAANLFGKAAAA